MPPVPHPGTGGRHARVSLTHGFTSRKFKEPAIPVVTPVACVATDVFGIATHMEEFPCVYPRTPDVKTSTSDVIYLRDATYRREPPSRPPPVSCAERPHTYVCRLGADVQMRTSAPTPWANEVRSKKINVEFFCWRDHPPPALLQPDVVHHLEVRRAISYMQTMPPVSNARSHYDYLTYVPLDGSSQARIFEGHPVNSNLSRNKALGASELFTSERYTLTASRTVGRGSKPRCRPRKVNWANPS